jgi:NadR type nicotinamide-nucleotide adenylyltransferase
MNMSKKIAIIGPESTGKSTLSQQLALHYKTAWVAEYAREYLHALHREYDENDLLQIAKGQIKAEDSKQGEAENGLFFCDTDLYVIKVWSEHKYHICHPWILQQIARRQYDLYLLTYIDVPWQDDPQREYPQPDMRAYFYHVYRDIVIHSGVPWADIRGSKMQRLEKAVEATEFMLSGG